MEILLLFVVIGILILIVRNLSVVRAEVRMIKEELQGFRDLINSRLKDSAAESVQKPKAVSEIRPTLLPEPEESQQIIELPGTPKEIPTVETPRPRASPDATSVRLVPSPVLSEPIVTSQSWFNKWLQENPDIEKFIGENLINKIGISVLVLGIAFFVKYAIDQEWINKTGRVCIGLFCGVILTWLANRLRKNYHAFSSVLIGGAIAIFYFTIAFAFHQYHLIGQGTAFAGMVIITVFAVVLSVLYDRLELGILATVGGFITPFLVSQGDGNWMVLFSYLTILNVGLVILAFYKRWRVINFIAFFFTQIIYLTWMFTKTGSTGFNYDGVFLFGVVFYLVFLVMNVIHHVFRGSRLRAFDFIILLSANLCFYGAGMYLISESGVSQFRGLFTASLGIVNLLLAYLFFRRSKADKNFIYLLIGITISFISLAAPVQLKGHYITLFWSAEIVVLLWLYRKSFISFLKIAVLVVTVLMLISLFMDWSAVYWDSTTIYPILFNKGWVTGTFSALSLYLVSRLLLKEADTFYGGGLTNKMLRNIYLVGSILLFYASGAFEINDQFTKRVPGTGMQVIYLQLYLSLFVLTLLYLLARLRIKTNPYLPVVLPLLVVVMYMIGLCDVHAVEENVLLSGKHRLFFPCSWLGAATLLLLIWKTIRYIRINSGRFIFLFPHFTWVIAAICVVLFSTEIGNLYIWINYANPASLGLQETNFGKAGLTIVWALSSFAMIWLGMKYRYKPLRITALILFGITLIKLFLFDIRNIAPGGKIVAFILLGALLLIISFMYQRLKKIIIDDSKDPD